MVSALFPDKVKAIAEIRALLAPHAAQLINMKFLSDDMIWDKLMAAESEAERVLKAFFSAVEVRPVTTQEETFEFQREVAVNGRTRKFGQRPSVTNSTSMRISLVDP